MGTIHAIYEDGIFRPTEPVLLPDKCKVEFEPRIVEGELVQDLDAIYAVMSKRFNSGEHDVAERHNEHQP
jgi:predicted DNA-binding antitoxin AbrB/MazE fold protein